MKYETCFENTVETACQCICCKYGPEDWKTENLHLNLKVLHSLHLTSKVRKLSSRRVWSAPWVLTASGPSYLSVLNAWPQYKQQLSPKCKPIKTEMLCMQLPCGGVSLSLCVSFHWLLLSVSLTEWPEKLYIKQSRCQLRLWTNHREPSTSG